MGISAAPTVSSAARKIKLAHKALRLRERLMPDGAERSRTVGLINAI
jgi:hypothetical protein